MTRTSPAPLHGACVVITRPVGAGAALARRVHALGGHALLLPGLSLRGVADTAQARHQLNAALRGDIAIFTSPAAVRCAARLGQMRPATSCRVCAVGASTARALHRLGIAEVVVPERSWTSEGLLAHPALHQIRGRHVALIGASGGRDLLPRTLRERGAQVTEVHVYRRQAARLDRRHVDAVLGLHVPLYVLLSSAEALSHLRQGLPAMAWARLEAGVAVVSSPRLATAARGAGFTCIVQAPSATDADLVATTLETHLA